MADFTSVLILLWQMIMLVFECSLRLCITYQTIPVLLWGMQYVLHFLLAPYRNQIKGLLLAPGDPTNLWQICFSVCIACFACSETSSMQYKNGFENVIQDPKKCALECDWRNGKKAWLTAGPGPLWGGWNFCQHRNPLVPESWNTGNQILEIAKNQASDS